MEQEQPNQAGIVVLLVSVVLVVLVVVVLDPHAVSG